MHIKYAYIFQNLDSICKNMQQKCAKYAVKYAKNDEVHIRSSYFAYFTFICTPHFADDSFRVTKMSKLLSLMPQIWNSDPNAPKNHDPLPLRQCSHSFTQPLC